MSKSAMLPFVPYFLAKMLLGSCGLFLMLGGCTWLPFGPDKDKADAGTDAAREREDCTLKVSACRNSCYESSAGSKCLECCRLSGESCDIGGSYSFYSCPDAE